MALTVWKQGRDLKVFVRSYPTLGINYSNSLEKHPNMIYDQFLTGKVLWLFILVLCFGIEEGQ